MAGSVNKCIIVGNVVRDPEIKSFPNGGKIANFTIATSETWKNKEGEKQERTEWHNIVIRNEGLVGVVERYVKKGSKLYIEGSLQTRKWQDASGNDRYTTEIVLAGTNGVLTMLDGNSKATDGQNEGSAYEGSQKTKSGSSGYDMGLDDDVPF